MSWMRAAVGLALLSLLAASADAARFHRRSSGTSLRRRLYTSPLITEPGNVDLEWAAAFDTNGSSALPTTLKWTPRGEGAWWGRTEFSTGFDTLADVHEIGDSDVHFSDHLNLAATTLLGKWRGIDFAAAPQATVFLRGESGARLGGLSIARFARGGWNLSSALSWTGATRSSLTNPAGTWDINGGLGRQFGKWSVYVNAQWERSTSFPWQVSLFEGIEYQFNERFALDFGGQHYSLNNGQVDHQFLAGFTWTLWGK